ncbi:NUDIX domain-containing protein [Streptomyces rubrogriseus]|uniref:NUDIX domain-containing protein n=1 Tax=Streptomyces rubrogriseus TaxID=194673 RepID=UPI00142E3240|nr:NUDIX domain-containing protein [Streptomyces rubrogriseus]
MERPLTRGFPGFQLQFATRPLASPGGTVEYAAATPEHTLHREATEEAQLPLADLVRPGWVLDMTGKVYGGVGPNARLRPAARGHRRRTSGRRPCHRSPFARLLTPARAPQAAALLGWGPPGARQPSSRWTPHASGGTRPTRRSVAIQEVPVEGMRLS